MTASVAVVGAGPAGSTLAALLAGAGIDTVIFHAARGPKHCGGGIPPRAFDRMPLLRRLAAPRADACRISFFAPGAGAAPSIELPRPISVFDRAAFDRALRGEAEAAGARLVAEGVRRIERRGSSWAIEAGGKAWRAGFLAGADGATGIVRRLLSTPFSAEALSLCAGYYLAPPEPGRISIGFVGGAASYAWLFPGPSAASAGIVAPLAGSRGERLRRRLRAWLEASHPGVRFDWSRPYAALVPTPGLRAGRVGGGGWALAGDAAGLADPATREGIYYSMRSAALLARCIVRSRPAAYPALLRLLLLGWHGQTLLARRLFFTETGVERFVCALRSRPAARRAAGRFIAGPPGCGRFALDFLISSLRAGE
ncbi:MAG TPA: NAD(P)/FAD-dependent oxidoreductase [bacterium]|nr:NAD(P)/FAD-dependent oxidoreductase [Chlamydiota bacterium]HOE26291.1 NAD(P)/FAD-dependent oxidoreductase [bacterium]HQM52125.1 NAD(P)/FAD-dependent oxidoreductase [bacterium]